MLIEKLLSDEAKNDDFLKDEFLDFSDQLRCRTKILKENVHEAIVKIARQEGSYTKTSSNGIMLAKCFY